MDAKTEAHFQRDTVEDFAPPLVGPCCYCGHPADNYFKNTGQFMCDKCINLSLAGYQFCKDCGEYNDGWCKKYQTHVPRTFYDKCNAPKGGKQK